MTNKDTQIIIDTFSRTELPELLEIISFDSLLYQINYIERLVRGSDAYKIWREYEKTHNDATIDAVENLDTSNFKKISLELHHYPHTLYDIVQYVGRKILDDRHTDAFEIAKLVLREHLQGNIGYVPLLITDHQKQHSNLLEIDDKDIKGNYKEFERKYL